MRLPLKTRLYYGIGRYVPFLNIRPPEVDREAVLTLRPLRHPSLEWAWETSPKGEKVVVVVIPDNPNVGRVTRWIARRWNVPTEHRKELDEVGGTVWELCDGDHSVESIVRQIAKRFRLNRREAEVSVPLFLQTLHEKNLIGFYRKTNTKKSARAAGQGTPTS